MLYIKCPSCKTLLGDKQDTYEKIINAICQDFEAGKITQENADLFKQGVINSFGLKYCCKMRLMTYRKIIEFVK